MREHRPRKRFAGLKSKGAALDAVAGSLGSASVETAKERTKQAELAAAKAATVAEMAAAEADAKARCQRLMLIMKSDLQNLR